MKKAIGYVRVSSEDQLQGNGIERQTAGIREYCESRGLNLTEVISDEGRSAYSGAHLSDGNLGTLLKAIETGAYRDHALVLEDLDRLSRLGIEITIGLMGKLMAGGVELHQALKNKVTNLNDLGSVIEDVVTSYQGYEYSKKLSERVGRAWAKKKADAANGKPITANVPAWLEVVGRLVVGGKVVDPGKIVLVTEFKGGKRTGKVPAALVTEAFDLAASGLGAVTIAKKLFVGKSGLGIEWMRATLNSRAVLGEYTPSGCEPAADYFPRIVDQSVWDKVRANAAGKRKCGRVIGIGRNFENASNLFPGLIFDGDRKMDYAKIGAYEYLVTRSNINDSRKIHRANYADFEQAFLTFLKAEDWIAISNESHSNEELEVQKALEAVLSELDRTNRRINAKMEAMDADLDVAALKVLASQIAKDEARVSSLETERDVLKLKVDATRAKAGALCNPNIGGELSTENRQALRNLIKGLICRIEFNFAVGGAIRVTYINGARKSIIRTVKGFIPWDKEARRKAVFSV